MNASFAFPRVDIVILFGNGKKNSHFNCRSLKRRGLLVMPLDLKQNGEAAKLIESDGKKMNVKER